jgi:hypothetical protein
MSIYHKPDTQARAPHRDLVRSAERTVQGHDGSLLGTTYEITLGSPSKPSDSGGSQAIRKIKRWSLQAASKTIMPEERVKNCYRLVKPDRKSVDILKSKENVFYSGLTVCGSLWICPVCAAKISERRRNELKTAVARAKQEGYQVLLLTQTIPHYSNQRLKPLMAKFALARTKQRQRYSWLNLADSINLAGTLRSLETTYGQNGFHIHTHELLFIRPGAGKINIPLLMLDILSTWQRACKSAGLPTPSIEHGVDLRDGSYADQYVNKWGLEEEMTKSHVKQGRENSLTPWDFLRIVLETGDCEYADLFREYAKAFKGKRQLVWSRGLRDLLGLDDELTDLELATKEEDHAEILASLTLDQWRFILSKEVRGEVLEHARALGLPGVLTFLAGLRCQPH